MQASSDSRAADAGALSGQVALVCGSTGPIGQAIARALAVEGAAVALHYRSRDDIAGRLASEIGPPAVAIGGQLETSSATQAVFAAVAERLGRPPTIVVNAASPSTMPTPTAMLDDDTVDAHLAGLRMHVNVCRAAIPGMRAAGGGRIVFVSGALASRLHPAFGLYSAAKAAATTFSRTLALEEGAHGIRVNVVAPGRVVESTERPEGDDQLPEHFAGLVQVMRLRRALPDDPSPEDVAALVTFLASPAAAAVTGQVVYLAAGEPIG
ncbi:MAG: SDR family oxidoreductase [Gaiellales bacterium]